MFWGDRILEEIEEKFKDVIKSGKPLIVRDEKTASGRVHVGSMRGVAIHGIIDELLNEKKIPHSFLYEINDSAPMDGLPVYLDEKKYLEYMGKPLYDVPSPDEKTSNFAEYFGQEFISVIEDTGFAPEYYRSGDYYKSGKFNEAIRLALEKADVIRKIYKDISGSVKASDWLPISIVCENCGKMGTTKARDFDGETVEYTCGKFVEWADGCEKNGRISPFDGKGILPWKVEWAAKFLVLGVHIEGGGKDHSTKGGAREIADAIARKVFKIEPPLNIPYEFFQIRGKKMSSSKGAGSSAREIADLLPPHIFRMLLIQKEPQKVLEFDPEGDTIPVLFDNFDTYAKKYFEGIRDDFTRIFELSHFPSERGKISERHLPRFSMLAFISQMPHIKPKEEIEKLQEIKLTKEDEKELSLRIDYVGRWIEKYAPEEYKFEIQKNLPENAKNLSEIQKQALQKLVDYLESKENLDGQELHTKLHEIKTETGIEPKEFFSAIYLSILGKTSGPKAGWFLSVLEREFLINRFKEVI